MGFDGTIFYLKDLKTTFVVAIELPTGSTANSSPHVPPSLVSGLSRASNLIPRCLWRIDPKECTFSVGSQYRTPAPMLVK